MSLTKEDTVDSHRVHVPVLADEVLEALRAGPGEPRGWFVDGTVGAGGHAARVLEAFPEARVLGIDQDESALEVAARTLEPFGDRVRLACCRLSELDGVLEEELEEPPVGLLLDLGANSLHFDRPERGFSFQADGPLDMRMDRTRHRTAADIVNTWDEEDLADLFYHEGGESQSRRIAHAIVEARRRAPFLRTMALAEWVAEVRGGAAGKIHPATKVFQALRRAVNEEGEELLSALATAEERLADGGRLAVISFHEGEDRIVKRFFREGVREGRWEQAVRRPVAPTHEELRRNRRARSARLRSGWRTRRPA